MSGDPNEFSTHVVIRLPFARPPGFENMTIINWTEEHAQQLWHILSQQKMQNIDWQHISRLLNVPSPFLMRYAAFLYENQLRGLQHRLHSSNTTTTSFENKQVRSISAPSPQLGGPSGVGVGNSMEQASISSQGGEGYRSSLLTAFEIKRFSRDNGGEKEKPNRQSLVVESGEWEAKGQNNQSRLPSTYANTFSPIRQSAASTSLELSAKPPSSLLQTSTQSHGSTGLTRSRSEIPSHLQMPRSRDEKVVEEKDLGTQADIPTEELESGVHRLKFEEMPAFLPMRYEDHETVEHGQVEKIGENQTKTETPSYTGGRTGGDGDVGSKEGESEKNSITSSFSDLSSSSLTRSAMEDAFLSNFNSKLANSSKRI
ncbi:uncharacterized protein VTP21DRAFT_1614 [Calcarisporiella thermophila]|uniref:uncharacterized protein n=1 Tax=Calcarisporiella thermophila TaxID=911321 RepID=UPI0037427BE1